MFESWYSTNDEKPGFWLEFQVVNDGLEPFSSQTHQPQQQTFPLFPLLPPELRLKIWENLILPRVVLAACFNSRFASSKRAQLALRPRRPSIPVLLHISHETRTLALRHYERAFSWKIPRRLAAPEAGGAVPTAAPARVWFNFAQDALLLLGDLEPFDSDGFNAPMVYFLGREDTRRVRHVACAFEELHLGVYESELIFGSLFHVIDRFPAARRLLITSTPQDAEVKSLVLPAADNVIQKLWWAWLHGTSVVTSSLAKKQILMIREDDLASFIARQPA
ncbi:hypothetical protein B0T19DRAFT_259486 [Cercophora scortea]|uniref:2EXR domain-containing protein n=1 Tax=Cercophora scortea TaxID=314031 RepID=A0AAE0M7U5_9PEZI|nr:hypothetical protein B0T19DRAFT_259486 [Cercophora scortea]